MLIGIVFMWMLYTVRVRAVLILDVGFVLFVFGCCTSVLYVDVVCVVGAVHSKKKSGSNRILGGHI